MCWKHRLGSSVWVLRMLRSGSQARLCRKLCGITAGSEAAKSMQFGQPRDGVDSIPRLPWEISVLWCVNASADG